MNKSLISAVVKVRNATGATLDILNSRFSTAAVFVLIVLILVLFGVTFIKPTP